VPQHYTLSTVEVSAWCSKCRKDTPHRVAARRLQHCLVCWDKSAAESAAKKSEPKAPEQGKLFGG
jgi:hypothetical protein